MIKMNPIFNLISILLLGAASCTVRTPRAHDMPLEQRIIGGWQTAVDEEGLDVHGLPRDRLTFTFFSDRCTALWGETGADDHEAVAYHLFTQIPELSSSPVLLLRSVCGGDEQATFSIDQLDKDSLVITRLDLDDYVGDQKSITLRLYRISGPPENFE